MSVEVESPAATCNLAAVALDRAEAFTPVVAGTDAEVLVAEHGVAVTGNDQVARCPKTRGQCVDDPAENDHFPIMGG